MKVKWLTSVTVDQRVMMIRDLDFPPFFCLREGMEGVVEFVNSERGVCSVRMDEPVEGSELWDNEVYFNCSGAAAPHEGWYVLQDVSWPLPKR